MNNQIESENILLIPCDIDTLEFAIRGNTALSEHLKVIVPDNWTEFGVPALQYALDQLKKGKEEAGWWTHFPIHKTDMKLIGSCGYKGKPNKQGEVEIGYEVAPEYRNKGFATELVGALVKKAFALHEVNGITAHTLGEINASTKVLTKCGFDKIAELNDDEAGIIWKWELKKKL